MVTLAYLMHRIDEYPVADKGDHKFSEPHAAPARSSTKVSRAWAQACHGSAPVVEGHVHPPVTGEEGLLGEPQAGCPFASAVLRSAALPLCRSAALPPWHRVLSCPLPALALSFYRFTVFGFYASRQTSGWLSGLPAWPCMCRRAAPDNSSSGVDGLGSCEPPEMQKKYKLK